MKSKFLSGTILWAETQDTYETEINRVAFQGKDVIFLIFSYDNIDYSITLNRTSPDDNLFSGASDMLSDGHRWKLEVTGRLYSYGKRHVVVGQWNEVGRHQWIMELEEPSGS